MTFRARPFVRAFRATRSAAGSEAASGEIDRIMNRIRDLTPRHERIPYAFNSITGPAWGTEVNEPGGRLFGEAIRKPGERRKLFDWEVPYIGTLVVAGLILGFGLSSRPETSAEVWAREEALAREAAREAAQKAEEAEED